MSFSIPKIKAPLLLLLVLSFSLFFGAFLPVEVKSFFYALSLAIKELLIFALPFFIFSFVLSTVIRLQNRALQFALLLVPMVVLSNFTSTWIAYFFGTNLIAATSTSFATPVSIENLAPFWSFSIPKIISNDWALLTGFLSGFVALLVSPKLGERVSEKLLKLTYLVLNRFFIPCMPVFIFGFTLKLQHDQVLVDLCINYLVIFIIILSTLFGYLLLSYALLNRFSFKGWLASLRNMLPAFVAGFSTMSSAAAMPLTIIGSEKNSSNPDIARSVIPATVNIHLVGDCFAIPILAMAIMQSFGQPIPNIETYFFFSIYFVLAKFAVAAVPGGGILVMLPILEHHLQFSAPMLSWITTLYIIFDSVITSANVLGNGAFAMLFSRTFQWVNEKTTSLSIRRR